MYKTISLIFLTTFCLMCGDGTKKAATTAIPLQLVLEDAEILTPNCFLRQIFWNETSDSLITFTAHYSYDNGTKKRLEGADSVCFSKQRENLMLKPFPCIMEGRGDAYQMQNLMMLNDSIGYWAINDYSYRCAGFLFKITKQNKFCFLDKKPNQFSGQSGVVFIDNKTKRIFTLHTDYSSGDDEGIVIYEYIYQNGSFERLDKRYKYRADQLIETIGSPDPHGCYEIWKCFEGVMCQNNPFNHRVLKPTVSNK